MTHHHFRLQRADGFQCYADNDQDGSTTHCQRTEVRVHPVQSDREDRNDAQEERTHQRILAIKSAVGLPGRMPGMPPLL